MKLNGELSFKLVDTCAGVAELVEALTDLPVSPPSLYVDLEGVNLSRHGTVSILQIYVLPQDQSYLVDVYTLGGEAFSTKAPNGRTLRDILESPTIPKVFFDVRNDSDALYGNFGVNLGGVQDLQLMELATRRFSRRYVSGLAKCIERDAIMPFAKRQLWKAAKEKGLDLYAPQRGGSFEVFNARPLSDDLALYCVQDVRSLPDLWETYHRRMTPAWAAMVEKTVRDRIAESQSASYESNGSQKALAPQGWFKLR
ncbi:hypothetical protein AWENTII_008578 [Aspergillus wentii]